MPHVETTYIAVLPYFFLGFLCRGIRIRSIKELKELADSGYLTRPKTISSKNTRIQDSTDLIPHFQTLFRNNALQKNSEHPLLVQQKFGHRSILNTILYRHLVDWKAGEYDTATATTIEDARKLAEDSSEKWDVIDSVHVHRKRK